MDTYRLITEAIMIAVAIACIITIVKHLITDKKQ